MNKLHTLSSRQVRALTILEARTENYILTLRNIPNITVERAAEMIKAKVEKGVIEAKAFAGFDMKAQVIHNKGNVIVDFYPADEEAPKHVDLSLMAKVEV